MVPLSDGSAPEPRPAASKDVPAEAVTPSLSVAEELPGEVPGEYVTEFVMEPRRYPSTVGGTCYLVLLAVAVLALVLAGLGHWRGGVHILGGVMGAAAVLRAVLPRRDAGMLAVRSRWFDVSLLAVVAAALWVLATTTPDQV